MQDSLAYLSPLLYGGGGYLNNQKEHVLHRCGYVLGVEARRVSQSLFVVVDSLQWFPLSTSDVPVSTFSKCTLLQVYPVTLSESLCSTDYGHCKDRFTDVFL